MADKTLFLHAGRPKTASTFLQRTVFPQLDTIDYIEKPHTQFLTTQQKWETCLGAALMRSPKIWEAHGSLLMEEILGRTREDERSRGSVLVSDESVAGPIGLNPSANYYWRDPLTLGIHITNLRRLSAEWGFDRFKILLLVRRQDHAIASGYAQISDQRQSASQSDFDAALAWLLAPDSGAFQGGVVLDYYFLYQQLAAAIGNENLKIIPYEMLRDNSDLFLSELTDFLNIDQHLALAESDRSRQNVRAYKPGVWTIRKWQESEKSAIDLIPGILAQPIRYQKQLAWIRHRFAHGKNFSLSGQQSSAILNAYESSNRALAAALDIDLARYGYYGI